jgi:predicted HicB family RNase H-like nuclease
MTNGKDEDDIAVVALLSPELHRKAKATAAMNGVPLRDFVKEAVEKAVKAAGHVE